MPLANDNNFSNETRFGQDVTQAMRDVNTLELDCSISFQFSFAPFSSPPPANLPGEIFLPDGIVEFNSEVYVTEDAAGGTIECEVYDTSGVAQRTLTISTRYQIRQSYRMVP